MAVTASDMTWNPSGGRDMALDHTDRDLNVGSNTFDIK
jgi:hypothetical protein